MGSNRAEPSGNIFDQILTDLVDFDTKYQDSFIPFISGYFKARTKQLDNCPVVFDHYPNILNRLINMHGVLLLEFCKHFILLF